MLWGLQPVHAVIFAVTAVIVAVVLYGLAPRLPASLQAVMRLVCVWLVITSTTLLVLVDETLWHAIALGGSGLAAVAGIYLVGRQDIGFTPESADFLDAAHEIGDVFVLDAGQFFLAGAEAEKRFHFLVHGLFDRGEIHARLGHHLDAESAGDFKGERESADTHGGLIFIHQPLV